LKAARLTLVLLVALLVAAIGSILVMRALSPEVAWRMAVVTAKLRGDLPGIPLLTLATWLAPGSATYLEPLATTSNLHAGIRNRVRSGADSDAGKALFAQRCSACHGPDGHGSAGPNLVDAVANKSDWSFFSSVKWGLPGTAMLAQPLADREIWQVHAFLRAQALGHEAASASRAPSVVNVEPRRILDADAHPNQWLTYAGNYRGHRHSRLSQITRANVAELGLAWVSQLRQVDRELQVTPLVVDGVMYVTESREGVIALDARTGKVLWTYRRAVPDGLQLCCGMPNRGAAISGDTIYVGTIDAHLVALDANTGKQRWIVKVAEHRDGYSITGAPLALPDRIVTGVAGSVYGARGFLAAYDLKTGAQLWKFDTVPAPGQPGNETWPGDSWRHGGAATWTTGSYDAEQDLVIWGTGNPAPQFHNRDRLGDNLYSNCVIALDAKTGRLRWYYQFTPGEEYDWDSTQQPILTEMEWQGRERPVLTWANRNGFYYVLDRRDGKFLLAKPFVKQSWNAGFDEKGRPRFSDRSQASAAGTVIWPATMAATNWWPPSLDRARNLLFVPSSDAASVYYRTVKKVVYERDRPYQGIQAAMISPNHPAAAYVKAIDIRTGEVRWQTELARGPEDFIWTVGGVLSTGTGLTFAGYRDDFYAFDSETGKVLWKVNLGARVRGSPVSYAVGGQQYVAIAAGHSIFTFAGPASDGAQK
jgi:alcohol dehydrogenase (cytochrome c)